MQRRPLFGFRNHLRHQQPQPQALPAPRGGDSEEVRQLHAHDYLISISDRVEQTAAYPFVADAPLVKSVVDTLLSGTSVLLVGEPGIGKRTISLGVARALHARGGPTPRVYTLSLGREFWSTTEGESIAAVQNEIRLIFQLVQRAGTERVIFCIDDLDVLNFIDRLVLRERPLAVRDVTEPLLSLENMLRFLLFSRRILCLCTCIRAAYERLKDSDTYYDEKFSKSFRVIPMAPPDRARATVITAAHAPRIETGLHVVLNPGVVEAAVAASDKFLTHRSMPEKAIELVQECAERAIVEAEGSGSGSGSDAGDRDRAATRIVVSIDHVTNLIHHWCGINSDEVRSYIEQH